MPVESPSDDSPLGQMERRLDELRFENEQLRVEISTYKKQNEELRGWLWFATKQAAKLVVGRPLWIATEQLSGEALKWQLNKRAHAPIAETIEFFSAAFRRLVRVAWFGVAMTLLGGSVVLLQTWLLHNQNRQIAIQNTLADSSRRSALIYEISSILDKIDEEVNWLVSDTLEMRAEASSAAKSESEKLNGVPLVVLEMHKPKWEVTKSKTLGPSYEDKKIRLSAQLNGRIAAITRSLKPYSGLNANGEIASELSFERGLILKAMLASRVSLIPFRGGGGDFTFSDLSDSNLVANELTGLDLRNADFRGANLKHTDFSGAILVGAKFHGANIENAIFEDAIMPTADAFAGCAIGTEGASLAGAHVPDQSWEKTFESLVVARSNHKERNFSRSWHGEDGYVIESFEADEFGYKHVVEKKMTAGTTGSEQVLPLPSPNQ